MIKETLINQRVVEKLRSELVPNFSNMDILVQREITDALIKTLTAKNNQ